MNNHIQLIEKEASKYYPETKRDKDALRRICPRLLENKNWISIGEYVFALAVAEKNGLELRTQPLLMEA